MYLKILIILFSLLYQNTAHSKATEKNQFNQKYLSNYFSALVSVTNQKNDDAIIFFNSSKFLMNKHDNFLREYVFSLVLGGQVKNAINQIKRSNNSNFFEGDLLLALESITKKNYKQAEKRLKKLLAYQENEAYEFVIIKILESYNHLFLNSRIKKNSRNLGRIDLITSSFQNCYLGTKKTDSNFLNLINSSENEYSRYLFFHLGNIIEKKDYELVNEISKTIDPLMSSLLIAQSKKWIDENKYEKFNNYFSCKSENDLLAEFFFLIANLYSSQDLFKESNFYLNLSNYLNPKFYFNLSLLAENYHLNNNLEFAKKILNELSNEEEVYHWFKTKKITEPLKNKYCQAISSAPSIFLTTSGPKDQKIPAIKTMIAAGLFSMIFNISESSYAFFRINATIILHISVLRTTTTFRGNPNNILGRLFNIASFAMDAVL